MRNIRLEWLKLMRGEVSPKGSRRLFCDNYFVCEHIGSTLLEDKELMIGLSFRSADIQIKHDQSHDQPAWTLGPFVDGSSHHHGGPHVHSLRVVRCTGGVSGAEKLSPKPLVFISLHILSDYLIYTVYIYIYGHTHIYII